MGKITPQQRVVLFSQSAIDIPTGKSHESDFRYLSFMLICVCFLFAGSCHVAGWSSLAMHKSPGPQRLLVPLETWF